RTVIISLYGHHRARHSFPTRRSSDLVYLEAVRLRMAGLTENPGRDRAWQNEIDRATALYSEAGGEFPAPLDAPEHLVRTRWLIEDRKSTRLNSSHVKISYAVFCLKKK